MIVALEDDVAFGGAELSDGVFEERGDVGPSLVIIVLQEFRDHGGCLPFVFRATGFGAECVGCTVTGDFKEPAGEGFSGRLFRAFREEEEDGLRDVLGGMRITNHAQGGGIDPVGVLGSQG